MKYLLSAIIFFTLNTHAQCFKYAPNKTSIKWGAYKTPAKAIVMGKFDTFTITPAKTSGTLVEILSNSKFTIDTSSVNTKNKSRDKKIVNNFFKNVSIEGEVKGLKKGSIQLYLTINGKQVKAPLSYKMDGNKLVATGNIDVFDFVLHDNLKAINKACKALHEGKTWNDVKIILETEFSGC